MNIGIVKEIKDNEQRVAMTPDGVNELIKNGHHVFIEYSAGIGSGFSDDDYKNAGAKISDASTCWDNDLVIKVKEPLKSEYCYLKQQILFTYLHLAAAPIELSETLLINKTTAIAYETLEDQNDSLPLLAPMSAVAGNMATLVGSYYLAGFNGGKGVQLGSVLNKQNGKVVIIGDGVVAQHSAKVALGMGSTVYMATRHLDRTENLKQLLGNNLEVFLSTPDNISELLLTADLVIGTALNRGAKAPYLITEKMIKSMQTGSVVVDVSIDQGGCIETSHPTSHTNPVFNKHGIIHYCVNNMPGAFPKTSTTALSTATLPYIIRLANEGITFMANNKHLSLGINCYQGNFSNLSVAESVGMKENYAPLIN